MHKVGGTWEWFHKVNTTVHCNTCRQLNNTQDHILRISISVHMRPMRSHVKPIRRIPRSSRDLAAKKLAVIIEAVVANPDSGPAWDRLFHFSSRCLRVPKRGGCRWNLARAINEQIRTKVDPPLSPSPDHPQSC